MFEKDIFFKNIFTRSWAKRISFSSSSTRITMKGGEEIYLFDFASYGSSVDKY